MNHINELHKILTQYFKWNKARISCLAQILQALICVRTVNLVQISSSFKSKAAEDSSYRRIRRFFSNYSFDTTSIVPFVLGLFSLKTNLILILDRTNWKWGKKDINILMLSLAFMGIGIPIFWIVLNTRGNSSTADRISLLKQVLRKIGYKRIQAFVADREFIGEEWFRFLIKEKIPFIIRIKKNVLAGGIQAYLRVPVINLWKNRGGSKSIINHPILLWGHLLYTSIYQSKKAKEPMIVVSNIEYEDAIEIYKKRWEIETLFGCLKTRGFRMEDTHITDPKRIEKLLFVLAIAFCWSYKAGIIKNKDSPISIKSHGRKSKSLFRIGLDYIRSILFYMETKFDQFLNMLNTLKCLN